MTDFLPPGLRAVALTTVVCTGCSNRDINGLDDGELPTLAYECTIPEEDIYAGALRDAIPALTDPALVPTSDSRVAYLQNDDRVVSLDVNNLRLAVPLNVLWWHEIVNLTIGQDQLAVTHCQLTGSSLVFDRSPVGGAEFGVSGLLYQTNLVMYDRVSGESLWPQMERGARCGPASGTELEMVPAIEMRWDEFRQLYPNGLVVIGADDERSPDREYSHYPYGPDYRSRDNTTSIQTISMRGVFPRSACSGFRPRRVVSQSPSESSKRWALPPPLTCQRRTGSSSGMGKRRRLWPTARFCSVNA